MGVEVLFFARIREQLGRDRLAVDLPAEATLADLLAQLVDEYGDTWREVLTADNVICAVNQAVAEPGTAVNEGDEVAFFPPVTGG